VSAIRLGLVASHPIQYQAPWFRALAAHPDLDIHVYYCYVATSDEQARAGFSVPFEWDVPLLDGYPYSILNNVGRGRSAGGFWSLDTPEIADVIARERFDAVMVLGWQFKSFWQAIWASWRTRTPVMVRGDSHLHTERPVWKQAAKWAPYRTLLPRFDACLAAGTWSRDYFLHYGVREDRIFRVPHVIDERFFTNCNSTSGQSGPRLRQKWHLEPDSAVFLFAAKFIHMKRPMDFVRAIELASSRGSRVTGLMVGDGPLRSQCEAYVDSRGLPIRFAGFLNQSEISHGYIAADALILPSDGHETWGLVVNEAMACARPCFVSDRVGCGPDLIVSGETGDVFPLGSVDTLADMLTYYGANRDILTKMGERSLALSETFHPRVAVEGTLHALHSVVGTRN
jgi:glycosyltransferase involved in cell wall biosynthesis